MHTGMDIAPASQSRFRFASRFRAASANIQKEDLREFRANGQRWRTAITGLPRGAARAQPQAVRWKRSRWQIHVLSQVAIDLDARGLDIKSPSPRTGSGERKRHGAQPRFLRGWS